MWGLLVPQQSLESSVFGACAEIHRGSLCYVNLGRAAVQLCVILRKTSILLMLQSTAGGLVLQVKFWVTCFAHHNVLKNYQYTFTLFFFFFFSILKPFVVLKLLIFRQKQYEAVTVVCRVGLRKVLLLIPFAGKG